MRTFRLASRASCVAALLALASTGLTAAPEATAAAARAGTATAGTCDEPVTSGGVTTVVCPYTGTTALWRVPAGVTKVTFDLYGAQGGSQADTARSVPGGMGAHLHSSEAMSPGQVLMIVVGGSPAPNSTAGGFNGGGSARGLRSPYSEAGGGGGGATDVRTGPGYALADRILVAGGGGGNGGNAYGGGTWAQGQAGGTSGAPGCCGVNGGGRGYAGTGGAAGAGGADIDYEPPPQTYAPSGSPGVLGMGGHAPVGDRGEGWGSGGGGGGGGGYYGGGGGGAAGRCFVPGSGECIGWATGGYGGGGGADYAGCCPLPHSWVLDGAREGNGLAVITYRTP